MARADPLACVAFSAPIIEWRGPAPFYFLTIPEDLVADIHFAARQASYGWGCVPVMATIAHASFTTSLIPRNGGYLLPLKTAVRQVHDLWVGEPVAVEIAIYPASPR